MKRSIVMTLAADRGFTLLELMVVIAVVGILAAIAYPSYVNHVTKAKRTEGKTTLLQAAQLQERNYVVNSTYANNNDLPTLFGLPAGATLYSGENPGATTSAYTIAVNAPSAECPLDSCFMLIAIPNAAAGFSDGACGFLTLSSAGVRGRQNAATPLSQCW